MTNYSFIYAAFGSFKCFFFTSFNYFLVFGGIRKIEEAKMVNSKWLPFRYHDVIPTPCDIFGCTRHP